MGNDPGLSGRAQGPYRRKAGGLCKGKRCVSGNKLE